MSCRLSAQILALVSMSEEKVDKRMDMGTNGFYGDTFDSGFGSFETAKRRYIPTSSIHHEDMLAQRPRLEFFNLHFCTMLHKFLKCEVKAARCGNFAIFLLLRFSIKLILTDFIVSKKAILSNLEALNFVFNKIVQFLKAQFY